MPEIFWKDIKWKKTCRNTKICIDLPEDVENVVNHLQDKISCEVHSVKQIKFNKKLEDIPENMGEDMFNKGQFKRYDIMIKFGEETENPREYLEKNVSYNVVQYF